MTNALTSIHGRRLGLDSSDNLVVAGGIIFNNDTYPTTLSASGAGTIGISTTASTAAASVDGFVATTTTAVTLGTYANAINGKLDFGSAGKVTGLGGAICAELDLGAATTSGSYACFEGELVMGTSASTGTRSSFFSLNLSGSAAATFDTNGFLFDLNGLTANTGKLLRTGLSQAVTASARLRVQVGGTSYYIPLCANEALTS